MSSKEKVVGALPKISNDESFDAVFTNFLTKNEPFLMGSEATKDWKSVEEWILPPGKLNFNFLRKHFGNKVRWVDSPT